MPTKEEIQTMQTKTKSNKAIPAPAPPEVPEDQPELESEINDATEEVDPADLANKFKGEGKPLSQNRSTFQPNTAFTYEELKARLLVDQMNLENEILEHPVLYDIVGVACTELWEQVSIQKFGVDTWESATALNLRAQLSASGEKATEGKIEALVKVDEELIALKEELIRTQGAHMRWQDLKRAYEERSNTLKMYTQLINGNYIAYQSA